MLRVRWQPARVTPPSPCSDASATAASSIDVRVAAASLAVRRTSEGGISNREPADLSEAAASLRATGSAAGRQQLDVQASLNPAPVLGDPHLIERLAVNLLDNAVRHNTMGGTVQLSTGQAWST